MATITEDFVSFETAKLLKEKGFNERLLTFYITDETKKEGYFQLMAFTDDKIDNNHSDYCYLAPTLQMAMKWLREVHNIHIDIDPDWASKGGFAVIGYCFNIHSIVNPWYEDLATYPTYEQVVEAAIKYCLENLI